MAGMLRLEAVVAVNGRGSTTTVRRASNGDRPVLQRMAQKGQITPFHKATVRGAHALTRTALGPRNMIVSRHSIVCWASSIFGNRRASVAKMIWASARASIAPRQ